ncbi:MAG TPA: hypothetical protein PLC53_03425 [Bacilli bacterium]|nr:hypothetical protein [Bacilli bacterium]
MNILDTDNITNPDTDTDYYNQKIGELSTRKYGDKAHAIVFGIGVAIFSALEAHVANLPAESLGNMSELAKVVLNDPTPDQRHKILLITGGSIIALMSAGATIAIKDLIHANYESLDLQRQFYSSTLNGGKTR